MTKDMPTATAPPYAYIVQAPVQLMDAYVKNKQQGSQSLGLPASPIFPPELFSGFTTMLVTAQANVIKMTSAEAENVMTELNPLFEMIGTIDRKLMEVGSEEDVAYVQLKSLFNNVRELLDDIHMVATAKGVDESSESYKKFLSKLIDESSTPDNKITYGKDALLNLFN